MKCPFCSPNKKEIIAENKSAYAIPNLKPVIPGHILINTKKHYERFEELSSKEVTDIFQLAQKLTPVLKKTFNGDGVMLAVQDGKSAGQTVPHFHIHLVPRKTGDIDNKDFYNKLQKGSEQRSPRRKEILEKEAELIRRSI